MAVVLGALSTSFFFLQPRGSLFVQEWEEQVGFSVEAHSEGSGHGSEFTVRLPI